MENAIEFNQELATSLYQSREKFPIDLEDAAIWLNYYDKSTAKRGFLNSKFIEGLDYSITAEPTTTGISANSKQKIRMTVDAFKMWAMMSGAEQGKQVTETVNLVLLDGFGNYRNLITKGFITPKKKFKN